MGSGPDQEEQTGPSEWLWPLAPSLHLHVRLDEAAGTQDAADTFPVRYHPPLNYVLLEYFPPGSPLGDKKRFSPTEKGKNAGGCGL